MKQAATGAIALDFAAIDKLFNSAAVNVALADSASLVWREQKGNFIKTIGADIYNLSLGSFFDKVDVVWEPPRAEVNIAGKLQTRKKTEELWMRYWTEFLAKIEKDPKKTGVYLANIGLRREQAKQNLARLFRDAGNINKGIEKEIGWRLLGTAIVKTVANSTAIVLSGAIAPGAAIAVGLMQGAVALRIQFYQNAGFFDKASNVFITVGGSKATAWERSLNSVHKTHAAKVEKLFARADSTVTQRLVTSLELDQATSLAGKASYGASVAKAAGRGFQAFAIGLEVRELIAIYQSTRN